jgi:hypothetical protein
MKQILCQVNSFGMRKQLVGIILIFRLYKWNKNLKIFEWWANWLWNCCKKTWSQYYVILLLNQQSLLKREWGKGQVNKIKSPGSLTPVMTYI